MERSLSLNYTTGARKEEKDLLGPKSLLAQKRPLQSAVQARWPGRERETHQTRNAWKGVRGWGGGHRVEWRKEVFWGRQIRERSA